MHTPTHSTDAPFPRPPCSTSQQGSGGARTLTHSPTRDRRTPAAHEAHAHGTKCMRDLGQTVRALAARMQTWQWHMPAALHPYDVTRHILFNRAMCSVSHHMRDGGGRALLVAHGPSLRPASSRSIRVSKHERSVLILLDGYEETQWAPANVAAASALPAVCLPSQCQPTSTCGTLRAHCKFWSVFHVLLRATWSRTSLTCKSGIAPGGRRWSETGDFFGVSRDRRF